MSTETGDAKVVAEFVADAKAILATEQAEQEQLDMLDPVTPEEILEARERLGPDAGRLALVRDARDARKRGRPRGARNKRTDDFARYLLSFGQHPAITMMQIQATDPHLLIEASKQEKVHSFRGTGEPNVVVERMSYAEAQSLRIRCAEGLIPYLESKKPIAVDATIRGVRVIEQRGEMKSAGGQTIDGTPIRVAKDLDLGDDA
jgi:hypothetical protein